MNNGADLSVKDVTRSFRTPGLAPVEVLRGVNLTLKAGARLAITGPSGSGKTTLLQLIGALDTPDTGEIRVNGRELAFLDQAARLQYRNREVGFVFQAHHLLPLLTAFENVMVPAWAGSADGAAERAVRLLTRVGLAERMGHFPGQLSGGERQRVAVARALLMNPGLILADEPTGALDQSHALSLIDLLLELNEEFGTTLLVVTHSDACAHRLGQRIQLENGRLKIKGDEYD